MHGRLSPSSDGKFVLENTVIPSNSQLLSWKPSTGAYRHRFINPYPVTMLKEMKVADGEDNVLWMSDSPFETYTAFPFTRYAYGDVLIAGLGLGIVPTLIARKPRVKSITVLEINKSVIQLVGNQLDIPNFTVIETDAWEYLESPATRKYDSIWGDIWPDMTGGLTEGKQFTDMAQSHLRDTETGLIDFWLKDFWQEIYGDLENLLVDPYHTLTKGNSNGYIVIADEQCRLCAKPPPYITNEGFCGDCSLSLLLFFSDGLDPEQADFWRGV